MIPTRTILSAFVAALFAATPNVDAAFPTVALKAVCLKQIHSPTTITYAPDGSGRLFVCDQLGKIYIIQNGMLLPTPFLNIANPANAAPNNGPGPVIGVGNGYSERGLLGLAFHPGYNVPSSPGYRKFYLNYIKDFVSGVDANPLGPLTGTNPGTLTGNCVSVIAEFQVSAGNPNIADPNSERRLLMYTQPQSNHNGGQVEFGPEVGPNGERYLYIGVGDGGSQEDNALGHTGGDNTSPRPTNGLGNAQDKTRLFGKILRIDPLGTNGPGGQYGIPPTNPFVGVGGGVREEIYSFGMRNPWRFSFDWRGPNATNRLFCGDVGGNRTEEIDIIVSGGNYGWRYMEGNEMPLFSSAASPNPMPHPGGTLIAPIAEYAHQGQVVGNPPLPQLGLSVTGGFVYRGPAIPALQGKYVFSDYGSTSAVTSWNSPLMGLEETAPSSGVFTLTQAIPLLGMSNPIIGQRILCLGEDESGEIYIGMKTNAGVLQLDGGLPSGGIYKIVPVQTGTASLTPAKDNTIFSEPNITPYNGITGYPSDALGYLYAGRTGPNHGPFLRRALITFDIASRVPSGAVVQSAQLSLEATKIGPGTGSFGQTLSLHRLNETWGEGTSVNSGGLGWGAQATTDDATWENRFFGGASWSTLGGAFVATASGTAGVTSVNVVFNSTSQMVADVQGWVNSPASNAGWIVRGDETLEEAVCQFSSLQQGFNPPALAMNYAFAEPLTRRETWLRTYFLVGQYVDDFADLEGDNDVNLVEYAYAFSPLAANAPGAGLQISSAEEGTDTVFTIMFRRDPRAVDLTYVLQTSSDLVDWDDITESIAGADPTGTGFLGEGEIVGEEPVRMVVAQETLPTPAKRFARLRITRTP